MSEDLIAAATAAVAAVKEAPPDLDAADAISDAGDVVGTREPSGDADGGDDGDAADVAAADAAEPEAAASTEETPAPVIDPKPEEGDDFDKVPAKDATGRTNRIPHPRVKAMVETSVRKAVEPLQRQNTEYVDRLTRIAGVEHIMFNEQPRFLEMLRSIPGYTELLGAGAVAPAAEPPKPAAPVVDWSKRPAPDGPDGSYTQDGLDKLLKFTADTAKAEALAEAEARLDARFGPIEKERKTREETQKAVTERAGRINSTIETANTWRYFPENAAKIEAALIADSEQAKAGGKLKYTGKTILEQLHKAYEDIVFGQVAVTRQKQREEIIAELKAAPRATSAGNGRTAPITAPEADADTPITSLDGLTKVALAAVRAHRGAV